MQPGKPRSTGIVALCNARPHYHVPMTGIAGGVTLKGILQRMPTDAELIDSEDVTFAVAMFNGAGKGTSKFSESSSRGLDLINLCVHLRKCRRPMLWIGGSSDLWSYGSPPWDAMCEKAVLVARAFGIPTITGERYLTHLELGNDKTMPNRTRTTLPSLLQCLKTFVTQRTPSFPTVRSSTQMHASNSAKERQRSHLRRYVGPPPLPSGGS